MPAAQRNLMVVLLQEYLEFDAVVELLLSILTAVGHMHGHKKIHGDLKVHARGGPALSSALPLTFLPSSPLLLTFLLPLTLALTLTPTPTPTPTLPFTPSPTLTLTLTLSLSLTLTLTLTLPRLQGQRPSGAVII